MTYLLWQANFPSGFGVGMRWFRSRQGAAANRRRFADLQAMEVEARRAALAGEDGPGWIEAAASCGFAEAQVLMGQLRLDGGRPALALRWFEAAARAGYPPGMNMVGRCFEKGWGVEPDFAEAGRHYRKAADLGLDWGQFNLANLLLYGLGIPRDRLQAFDWYGRAAQKGHAKSMNILGRFHEEGWDRPRNLASAAGWYQRAAEAGDFRAQFNLATVLIQCGRRADALAWLNKALANGSPDFLAQAAVVLRAAGNPTVEASELPSGAKWPGPSSCASSVLMTMSQTPGAV